MTPRRALVSGSAFGAAAIALAVGIAMQLRAPASDWRGFGQFALQFAPAPALAAGVAAWFVTRLHARATRAWSALGMAVRIVVLALVVFPLCAWAWLALAQSASELVADSGSYGDSMRWAPMIALLSAAYAPVVGGLPLFVLEFLLCRRYLRPAVAA